MGLLTGGLLAAPLGALGQPAKVYRVGFLFQGEPATPEKSILTITLRELGYVEGRNIVIDRRGAESRIERFPILAAELVALKPDVIIAESTSGGIAAMRATAAIPIVLINVSHPVGSRLVASLARPGGTGPYRFIEWVKDDHVTLERWNKYFRPGRPYVDRIIFYAPADDTVRLTGLQTGRFNWIQTVPPQRIPELERARDLKSSPGRPYFPFFFMLNASRPPLGDRRIRQAIAWALDRSEIVKLVYFGSHVVTAEPTPEPSPWGTGVNAHKGGPDLARAKQLLSDAGAATGLTLTYLVKSQVPVLVKTGEILREQLKKVGITLEVRPLESGQYFEELVGKKFDVAAAWWSVTVDPDLFYYPLQHSASPWNFCGFKSEEADRRIDAFRAAPSLATRKKMYPEMVRWFQEEGSLIVFSNEIQRYWMKPNVQGSVPLSSLELRFEDTWIA